MIGEPQRKNGVDRETLQVSVEFVDFLFEAGLRVGVAGEADTALVGAGGPVEGNTDLGGAGVGRAELEGDRKMPSSARNNIARAKQQHGGNLTWKDDRRRAANRIVDAIDEGLIAEFECLASTDRGGCRERVFDV